MSAECDKCGTDLQSNSRGMFCPMCEPTAPQTPEAATPRSDSAWNESTYEVENDPKSSWQAVAIRMCHEAQELERELQTVTAELDLANERIDAKQEAYSQCAEQFAATLSELATLRTALATAEALIEKHKSERDGWMHSSETWEWTHAKRVEEREDLRRQLTEAQAACAAKELDKDAAWRLINEMAKQRDDLLKRLSDAEWELSEANQVISIQHGLIETGEQRGVAKATEEYATELSRLQAEVKETRNSTRRELLEYCNRGGASWIATRQDLLEAIAAIESARPQPKP